MPDIEQPPQAQSAVDQTREAILDRIAEAELSGAPVEELVKSLATTRTKVLEPTKATEPVKALETPDETVVDETQAESTEEPAGDEPPVEPGEEGEQNRFRFKDPKDRAIAMVAKAEGISLAEAARRVSGEPTQSVPRTEQVQEITPDVSEIQAQVQADKARLGQIKAERLKFKEHPDLYGALAELDNEQTDILTRLAESNGALARADAAERENRINNGQLDRDKQTVLHSLVQQYPELGQKGTAHYKLARQEAMEIKSNPDDPDYDAINTPDFVTICAERAAKLLKITAKSPNAAPAAKSPMTPKAEDKQPGPASGSRASAPTAPAKTAQDIIAELDAEIERGISPSNHRNIARSGQIPYISLP